MYYDGTKLLSLKDKYNKKPEIYICTSNRNAGKTTFFNRMLVNRFLKSGQEFLLVYRFNYELDEIDKKFFTNIGELYFSNKDFKCFRKSKGLYTELRLNNEICGYGIALNNADALKKISHIFQNCTSMLFDEFQSENNHYCNKEVEKLQSIHTSFARGHGKQIRYLPVYLVGNPVSLLNPYYTALGISDKLKKDTKFLKGDGYVLEYNINETAKIAASESAFNRAFQNNSYARYASQAIYLNDNMSFIGRPKGKNRCICNIIYEKVKYGIKEYDQIGIMFVDDKPDNTCPINIAVTTDDHQINYVMISKYNMLINAMRTLFEKGCFRFKNLKCKEAIFKALSY